MKQRHRPFVGRTPVLMIPHIFQVPPVPSPAESARIATPAGEGTGGTVKLWGIMSTEVRAYKASRFGVADLSASPASIPTTSSTILPGSLILPGPTFRQASHPSSGPTNRYPNPLSFATFSCAIAFAHIRLFIAGANSTGHAAAHTIRLTRSSVIPCAIFARMLLVAGAT